MATATVVTRPPLPPFTRESAIQKVRLAEDSWNSRDPGKVALAYAIDSRWRNRAEFVNGRSGSFFVRVTPALLGQLFETAPKVYRILDYFGNSAVK